MRTIRRRTTRAPALLALGLATTLLAAACSSGTAGTAAPGTTTSGRDTATRDAPSPGAATSVGMRTTVQDGGLRLSTVSTRADLVTGGDVRVGVEFGGTGSGAEVRLNGEDVSSSFVHDARTWGGVVTGLRDGPNTLTASDGERTVTLDVVNHPKDGPVIAGPLMTPFACTTARSPLGEPRDANCNAPERTTWTYRATDGSMKDLADPSARPADLATTNVGGKDLPFIVRMEQGVIDRGIYSIWTLDPEPPAAPPAIGEAAPWQPTGWNQRLVYRFGGGCGTSYSQGSNLLGGGGFDADLVAHGYAVATNTLDTFQTNCNDVLSAEAAMLTREHFAERYGVPVHTIGDGGSGGAIQQLLIAQNYPGLLDALTPSQPFPDAITIAAGVTDCGLLQQYYRNQGGGVDVLEQMALSGQASPGTCAMWENLFLGGINPTDGCDATLSDQVYDPTSRPKGVRCTLQDANVNVLGTDPATGFARRPLDNVGVQYGLEALRQGRLSVDRFLDVNEKIGGYDVDGNIVPERTSIDEATAAVAYRTGRVTGSNVDPLREVPIILRNAYTDRIGDIHTRFHAFSIRERLRLPDGSDAPNLVLWSLAPNATNPVAMLTGETNTGNEPIYLADRWLDARDQQPADLPVAERVARARPADAQNRCVPNTESGPAEPMLGGWELYDRPGPCPQYFEVHGDPRTAAGEPIRDDVIKCTLKPIDPKDYGPATFSSEQRARLDAVFPKGVCDWSRPGVGQQPSTGAWQRY